MFFSSHLYLHLRTSKFNQLQKVLMFFFFFEKGIRIAKTQIQLEEYCTDYKGMLLLKIQTIEH